MADDVDERLAGNIRAELARRRITRQQLAEHLGVTEATISRRLGGQQSFRYAEVIRVAEFLGVPVAALTGGAP